MENLTAAVGNDLFSSVVVFWQSGHPHVRSDTGLWKGCVSFDFMLSHSLVTLHRLLHLRPEFLWFSCVCVCVSHAWRLHGRYRPLLPRVNTLESLGLFLHT